MSFVKYRVKEVAADFGVTPKDIAEIVGKYFEKPRSNTQVLTDEQLNVVFDAITQKHQIASLEQVFAVAPQAKKPEPKKAEAPKPAAQPAQGSAPAANAAPAAQSADKAAKPQQEQRKRERRVVDTSAVTVNADRFDDRVDVLISERAQNFSGGMRGCGSSFWSWAWATTPPASSSMISGSAPCAIPKLPISASIRGRHSARRRSGHRRCV